MKFLKKMMRLVSRNALAVLFALAALLGAGGANAADWALNFGTTGSNAYTSATAVDASGNVYISGYFDGATFTLGSVTLSRIGSQDAFAAKLDASGTVVWAKNYGGSGNWSEYSRIHPMTNHGPVVLQWEAGLLPRNTWRGY